MMPLARPAANHVVEIRGKGLLGLNSPGVVVIEWANVKQERSRLRSDSKRHKKKKKIPKQFRNIKSVSNLQIKLRLTTEQLIQVASRLRCELHAVPDQGIESRQPSPVQEGDEHSNRIR